MKSIKDDYDLKSRLELCLNELNYSINEAYYKKTLRMMLEYIDQTSYNIDNKNKQIIDLQEKLKMCRNIKILDSKEIRNNTIDEFTKEIVAEYDNDGWPGVTDYLDYRLSIGELFQIAEQMKGK